MHFGEWFSMKAGVPKEIQIIWSEIPGGGFSGYLYIEKKGVEYGTVKSKNGVNFPDLPIFRTQALSDAEIRVIRKLGKTIDKHPVPMKRIKEPAEML